jgi:hypothetical protein
MPHGGLIVRNITSGDHSRYPRRNPPFVEGEPARYGYKWFSIEATGSSIPTGRESVFLYIKTHRSASGSLKSQMDRTHVNRGFICLMLLAGSEDPTTDYPFHLVGIGFERFPVEGACDQTVHDTRSPSGRGLSELCA